MPLAAGGVYIPPFKLKKMLEQSNATMNEGNQEQSEAKQK